MPVFSFVKAKLPVSVPAKVSAPLLFTEKIAEAAESVTIPLPETLATCCAKPTKSKVPVTDSAVPIGSAFAMPLASVPDEIVVAPV